MGKGVWTVCPAFLKKNKGVISPDSRIRRGLGPKTQTDIYKLLASSSCPELNDLPSTAIFEPVAMELLGGAGRSTAVFLKELAKQITVLTGEKLAFKFFKQRRFSAGTLYASLRQLVDTHPSPYCFNCKLCAITLFLFLVQFN